MARTSKEIIVSGDDENSFLSNRKTVVTQKWRRNEMRLAHKGSTGAHDAHQDLSLTREIKHHKSLERSFLSKTKANREPTLTSF